MKLVRGKHITAAALLMALLAGSAYAQNPGSTVSATGFKVGDGRLHGLFDVDTRFDSVVGFFNKDSAGKPAPSGDLIFNFRPAARYELMSDSTTVNFLGSGEYVFYSGLLSPAARNLSRFQANVALETAFNKDGAVEFQLGDSLVRSDRTQNAVVGVGVLSLYNELHIAAPIHPGGKALELTPRIQWTIEAFDPLLTGLVSGCTSTTDITCNPSLVNQMNYTNLNFALQGRWKFFPKTALLLDANTDVRLYINNASANAPATLLRVGAGLAGLISARISVTLIAGVVHDFSGSNVTAPMGQAQFSYVPTDSITLSVGYVRTVMAVPVYGVFADDRGYLNGKLGFLGGRLAINGQAAFDYFSFYAVQNRPGFANVPGRNDVSLSLTVGPTFDITNFFSVGARYALGYRTSSATATTLNYVRHEATLNLSLHY